MTGRTLPRFRGLERTEPEFRAAFVRLADELGADADALAAVVDLETAGTWSPSVRNPHSGAIGLIQWLPSTARALGTSTEALARMSRLEQLPWMARYFRPYVGRLARPEDVYFAVFLPAYIGKSADTVLARHDDPKTAARYRQNRGFDATGRGFYTVADVARVFLARLRSGQSRTPRIPVPEVGTGPEPVPAGSEPVPAGSEPVLPAPSSSSSSALDAAGALLLAGLVARAAMIAGEDAATAGPIWSPCAPADYPDSFGAWSRAPANRAPIYPGQWNRWIVAVPHLPPGTEHPAAEILDRIFSYKFPGLPGEDNVRGKADGDTIRSRVLRTLNVSKPSGLEASAFVRRFPSGVPATGSIAVPAESGPLSSVASWTKLAPPPELVQPSGPEELTDLVLIEFVYRGPDTSAPWLTLREDGEVCATRVRDLLLHVLEPSSVAVPKERTILEQLGEAASKVELPKFPAWGWAILAVMAARAVADIRRR